MDRHKFGGRYCSKFCEIKERGVSGTYRYRLTKKFKELKPAFKTAQTLSGFLTKLDRDRAKDKVRAETRRTRGSAKTYPCDACGTNPRLTTFGRAANDWHHIPLPDGSYSTQGVVPLCEVCHDTITNSIISLADLKKRHEEEKTRCQSQKPKDQD